MGIDEKQPDKSFLSEVITIGHRGSQIWRLIPRRQRWTLWAAVFLMAVGGASNTAIPLLLGQLVDSVKNAAPESATATIAPALGATVTLYLALIGVAYFLREVLQVARRYLVEDTCTRLQKHLFVKLVAHLLMADLASLSHEKVGSLNGRMNRSVVGSVKFLRVGFLDFLPAFLSGGLALTAVLAKQPWLALAMASIIPLSLAITVRQLISQKGVRLDLMRYQEELDGIVVEQLGGIDDIRVANTHQREIQRVSRSAENLRARDLRHQFVMSLYGSSKAISEGLIHILVLGVAVYFAATGRISVGDILTYSMLFLSVMAPLNEVQRVIDEGHESSLLVAELLKFLAQPPDRSYQLNNPVTPDVHHENAISVDNLLVYYSIPNGTPKRAVDSLSVAIRQGEIVGIAGRSGCGKTTLLRTLLRLVHPEAGDVKLGNAPLHAVSRSDIAKLIGYVCQTPFVFSGTIADNIAYERSDATEEQIQKAASVAGIHDEIMSMAGGYGAIVTERGENMSGGQRQRLALARVFLKDPPIMILDEATSALDTISERRIQEALAADRGQRTVIMVSHRLSALAHTDRIVAFEGGRIVETGTYDELVARGGVFAQLVQSGTDPLAMPGQSHSHVNGNGSVAATRA